MPETSLRLQFPGAHEHELAARLDLPNGTPRAYALYAHCFSCSKDILIAARLSSALRRQGIALMRFDFTGLGDSGGDFSVTNFGSNLEDLRKAAQYLSQEHGPPRLLIGHSLGGAAVLAVARDIPGVRTVATINAPSDVSHVTHLFGEHIEQIREQGQADILVEGKPLRIQRQFLEDLDRHSILERVAALRIPLMIFHSPDDKVVSVEHAGRIYQAARHPKSFISLDGADHMLSRPEDGKYVAAILSAWVARSLAHDEASN